MASALEESTQEAPVPNSAPEKTLLTSWWSQKGRIEIWFFFFFTCTIHMQLIECENSSENFKLKRSCLRGKDRCHGELPLNCRRCRDHYRGAMSTLAGAAGKSPRKNGNRWYYHSVPRTVCLLFGQNLIEVSGIIEWIDNRE